MPCFQYVAILFSPLCVDSDTPLVKQEHQQGLSSAEACYEGHRLLSQLSLLHLVSVTGQCLFNVPDVTLFP